MPLPMILFLSCLSSTSSVLHSVLFYTILNSPLSYRVVIITFVVFRASSSLSSSPSVPFITASVLSILSTCESYLKHFFYSLIKPFPRTTPFTNFSISFSVRSSNFTHTSLYIYPYPILSLSISDIYAANFHNYEYCCENTKAKRKFN